MELCVESVAKDGIIATWISLIKWLYMWWFTWARSCVALFVAWILELRSIRCLANQWPSQTKILGSKKIWGWPKCLTLGQ